jgi:probable rRNA maturation factor
MEIAIQIRHANWRIALPDARRVTRKAAKAALALDAAAHAGEVSLVLADDVLLRTLNSDYRGIDKATNVLAFAYGEGEPQAASGVRDTLGDVIISFERTEAEAKLSGISLGDHLSHLVIHGVLHLLGYDHVDDDDAEIMEALEARVLAGIGIADPYAPGGAMKL